MGVALQRGGDLGLPGRRQVGGRGLPQRGQALVADILYAVGIAGAGVGSWLFFKPAAGAAPAAAPGGGDGFSLAPVPVPGGAAVMIHGSF